jgi:hypothetical protein
MLQTADPAVSEAKFDSEVCEFRGLRREYERRGWFLVEACFPKVFVLLAAPQVKPPAILCGVEFDYTNYDAEPPSVKLVDPFSRLPYLARDLPTSLNRAMPAVAVPGAPANVQLRAVQPLMQAHTPEEIPFLCIAGVREYHDHPGHTGDDWMLHRASGAGRLVRLLEVIDKYGLQPMRGYGVNLVPQITFDHGEAPA